MANPQLNADVAAINAVIRRQVAALPGCRFVDVWPTLADAAGHYTPYKVAPGGRRTTRTPDGVHLTSYGARLLADACLASMLADLPRTAHIFRSVANRPLLPSQTPSPFLGLDCGTGSGILLAAAWFQAKRNGIDAVRLFGVGYDPQLAKRTQLLFSSLGIGEILVADACSPTTYARLPDGPVAFVGNENVPAPTALVTAEPFSAIHAALFTALSRRLRQTVFFPESLVVRDPAVGIDIVLSKNNRFQPPRHYRSLRLRPRSIVIEGRLTRLWQVGKDFRPAISEPWLRAMQYEEPIHRIISELIRREPWRDALERLRLFHHLSRNGYVELLTTYAADCDIWETTYYHLLGSHADIIEWYRGTGLRPYLAALSEPERETFSAAVFREVVRHYPPLATGQVLFRFPRFFAVATAGPAGK